MKKVKMLINVAIISAIVSSAVAFKVKTNPNLYNCNSATNTCILVNRSDFASGMQVINTGDLYKSFTGKTCHMPSQQTDPCRIYTGVVWIND